MTPYFSPHYGGVESYVRDLSQEFVSMGHSVTVLTSRFDSSLPEREMWNGIEIIRVPLLATLFRSPLPRSMRKYLNTIQPDIAHIHTPPPTFPYFSSRLIKERGIPSVLTYHCDSDVPSRLASPLIRFADRLITSSIMKRSDRIIVTSRTYSFTSANTWKMRSDIIPVSADTSRFFPDRLDRERTRRKMGLEGKKVVLFVGRLVRHKGVTYLVEAMRFLDEDSVLLIVGDGEYRQHIQRFIRNRGMQQHVRMLGEVRDAELPSIYRAADVTVIPSTSRLEAFSIAAVESMASGVPILVSDIPGVREVIQNGVQGFVFRPMDAEDIAAKLKSLLSNEEQRKEMSKRCTERAKEFSSRAVAAKVMDVYEALLGDLKHNRIA